MTAHPDGLNGWNLKILMDADWGRKLDKSVTRDSDSFALQDGNLRMLDAVAAGCMMSVYCTCGRIVILDRSEMRIKLSLGKELQCMTCRNARISMEIDTLNDHYNGVAEEDEFCL